MLQTSETFTYRKYVTGTIAWVIWGPQYTETRTWLVDGLDYASRKLLDDHPVEGFQSFDDALAYVMGACL